MIMGTPRCYAAHSLGAGFASSPEHHGHVARGSDQAASLPLERQAATG